MYIILSEIHLNKYRFSENIFYRKASNTELVLSVVEEKGDLEDDWQLRGKRGDNVL